MKKSSGERNKSLMENDCLKPYHLFISNRRNNFLQHVAPLQDFLSNTIHITDIENARILKLLLEDLIKLLCLFK